MAKVPETKSEAGLPLPLDKSIYISVEHDNELDRVARLVFHNLEGIRHAVPAVVDMRHERLHIELAILHEQGQLLDMELASRHDAAVDLLVEHADAPLLDRNLDEVA